MAIDSTPVPPWLAAALARPPRSVTTPWQGLDLHRLEWGQADAGTRTAVLLHGGGAHAGWWRAVGGLLAGEGWHVVAPDLTGHGRSSHRATYTFTGWVEEIAEVIATSTADAVSTARTPGAGPLLVGHSMCGVVTTMCAAAFGADLGGVLVLDTPLGIPPPDHIAHAEQRMATPRLAATAAELHERFRLLPAQPVAHPDLLAAVARDSVARREGGWSWAFDPQMFLAHPEDRPADLAGVLAAAACPVRVVLASRSPVVPASDRDRLHALAADLPHLAAGDIDAHHHPMLDRPREVAALMTDPAAP